VGSKYKGPITKGSLVYCMHGWGAERGKPNFEHLYKVRSIGPKQAILDRVDKNGGYMGSYYRRGNTVRLYEREYHERNNQGGRYWYPYEWSMALYPMGEEGWDPIFNV
jgi:hypothetical protein